MRAVETQITQAAQRLERALARHRSTVICLGLWSALIRTRDGNKCAACSSVRNLAAHHICRKTFLPEARLQTGNGITLCRTCHRDVHAGFNGRADLTQPMDAQGGEKVETLCLLFGLLLQNARERDILCDELYFLSDSVLCKFKMFQGFDPCTEFPGSRLEQAHSIWNRSPLQVRNAILEANGFRMSDKPISGICLQFDDDDT